MTKQRSKRVRKVFLVIGAYDYEGHTAPYAVYARKRDADRHPHQGSDDQSVIEMPLVYSIPKPRKAKRK